MSMCLEDLYDGTYVPGVYPKSKRYFEITLRNGETGTVRVLKYKHSTIYHICDYLISSCSFEDYPEIIVDPVTRKKLHLSIDVESETIFYHPIDEKGVI